MLGWQNGEIVYFPCSIPGHNIKNYVGSDVISAPSFLYSGKQSCPFQKSEVPNSKHMWIQIYSVLTKFDVY